MRLSKQALRSIGSNGGKIFGNQAIGYVVEYAGASTAFLLVAVLLGTAGVLISCVPSPPKASKASKQTRDSGLPENSIQNTSEAARNTEAHCSLGGSHCGGVLNELSAGVAMAWQDKAFMSMLGVTVLANFNYWSHMPLLQVLATRMGASASRTGLLLSASGWGGLLASLMVTGMNPRRTGEWI